MKNTLSILAVAMLLLNACQKDPVQVQIPETPTQDPNQRQIVHRVLLEPVVSVNCGSCPLMHHEIEAIEDSLDNVLHMSHYILGMPKHPYTSYFLNRVNQTVFTPLTHINRRMEADEVMFYRTDVFPDVLDIELNEGTNHGIELSSTQLEGGIKVTVDVFTHDALLDGEYLVHAFLVEKVVTGEGEGYDQRNYGNETEGHPYQGRGDYIVGFEHTNVIRQVLTKNEGDVVSVDDKSGQYELTVSDMEAISRPRDFAVIAFITRSGEELKPVLNAAIHSLQ